MTWPKLGLTLQCGPLTQPGILKTPLFILKCGCLLVSTKTESMEFSLVLIDRGPLKSTTL